jgi:hypothetical protein
MTVLFLDFAPETLAFLDMTRLAFSKEFNGTCKADLTTPKDSAIPGRDCSLGIFHLSSSLP